jgi:hypothetical protein
MSAYAGGNNGNKLFLPMGKMFHVMLTIVTCPLGHDKLRGIVMNKALKACVIAICVLVVVSAASVLAYSTNDHFKTFVDERNFFYQAGIWRYCVSNEDFNAHYDDFLTVAQVAKKYVNEAERTDNRSILLGYDQKSQNYYLDYIIIGSNSERIELSEQEQKSLNSITQAFKCKDAQLENLRIFANRISFETDNGQYTLVYSMDDSKPTFLNLPGKDPEFYVRKIRENWYNVVKNPG